MTSLSLRRFPIDEHAFSGHHLCPSMSKTGNQSGLWHNCTHFFLFPGSFPSQTHRFLSRQRLWHRFFMKFLFDLFPVILFFASFKLAEHSPDTALFYAEQLMGDGVTPMTAPVFIATVIAILATICQVAFLLIRGRKVEPMLWISLVVIVVFGGLTIWLKNEMFIKWKPTILYWVFGGILLWGQLSGRNFIRMLLGKAEIAMPTQAWDTLQKMWILFFAVVGVINLAVAYTCSTDVWVNFKLFGLMALTLIFTVGIGLYMTKHATNLQR